MLSQRLKRRLGNSWVIAFPHHACGPGLKYQYWREYFKMLPLKLVIQAVILATQEVRQEDHSSRLAKATKQFQGQPEQLSKRWWSCGSAWSTSPAQQGHMPTSQPHKTSSACITWRLRSTQKSEVIIKTHKSFFRRCEVIGVAAEGRKSQLR